MRWITVPLVLAFVAVLAFAGSLAGTYKGTWSSDNQGGGDLTITFSGSSDSLKADVSFTYDGQATQCDVQSVKFDGSKLSLVMDYGPEGGRIEATISGVLDGKTLRGNYKTKSLADGAEGDTGNWTVTAK